MPSGTKEHGPWLLRVQAVVSGLALSGSVSLELAAAKLNTSPRTLQRRLCECNVKFSKLVEDSRLGIASALLRETVMSVQDIANRLGYSTPSGFARAFGKWAGQSPMSYRIAALKERQEWREMGVIISRKKPDLKPTKKPTKKLTEEN